MKEQAFSNLLDMKDVLDSLAIPFFLDGGTLLGAYRDKDFCADDEDDIDLTTTDKHEQYIPRILEQAQARGFALEHKWNGDERKTAQIAVRRNGVKVDLMFKRFKGDRAWWTVYAGDKAVYKSVPATHFEVSGKLDFKGTGFRIPADVEDYLAARYADWRTPVHRKDYNYTKSDKSIVGSYDEV